MSLPYQTLKPAEHVTVAGFSLPKRGCLTMAETHAVAELQAEVEPQQDSKTPLQLDLLLKQGVVTILLRSRLDKTWTIEHTRAETWAVTVDGVEHQIEPDMVMIDELFQFFMNEQRRWKTDEELAEESAGGGSPKKPTGKKSTGS